ncbi:protein_phosphatase 1 regulatory inhibitor subunit PPP1R7 homolog isoform X1 [Hexamita inflata]|uniref:Protein phosphatase 1 regulatory inhibitor subunit PPP1R7 homolog isoform X1 n=1 Tax=Hexamita inflata TaxID=28002 RepID=A0AA86TKR7_9EUKA|nr:protein phosphatase 1 regulatory inhibitor subunit PPP1R7 homolog isoform X1 [Hexamita inflata]CAI9918582.1 protein phosphatase 1 regulatory inhibitor subunit PPP1R7 homolog isoform X1 [Hexamita inflata]
MKSQTQRKSQVNVSFSNQQSQILKNNNIASPLIKDVQDMFEDYSRLRNLSSNSQYKLQDITKEEKLMINKWITNLNDGQLLITEEIESLVHIGKVEHLIHLIVKYQPSNSFLKGIQECGQTLQRLDLQQCKLNNLNDIQTVWNLQYLSVINCDLQYLDGIQSLKYLQTLDISKNRISSLIELCSLSQLHSINIDSNNVQDLGQLLNLVHPSVKQLNLNNNPISKLQSQIIQVLQLNAFNGILKVNGTKIEIHGELINSNIALDSQLYNSQLNLSSQIPEQTEQNNLNAQTPEQLKLSSHNDNLYVSETGSSAIDQMTQLFARKLQILETQKSPLKVEIDLQQVEAEQAVELQKLNNQLLLTMKSYVEEVNQRQSQMQQSQLKTETSQLNNQQQQINEQNERLNELEKQIQRQNKQIKYLKGENDELKQQMQNVLKTMEDLRSVK